MSQCHFAILHTFSEKSQLMLYLTKGFQKNAGKKGGFTCSFEIPNSLARVVVGVERHLSLDALKR